MKEALYYKRAGAGVNCLLCPQRCKIPEGKTGFCKVRRNKGGRLYSLIYGETTSIALDPIEKKPLYHFHPGAQILSLGTKGCNLSCRFCQNWTISQDPNCPTRPITPKETIAKAKKVDSIGIAYTYNEPFIWYEFIADTARLAREAGFKNVLVTNGFVNQEPLKELLPLIDAMNIDLKSMDDSFYIQHCRGSLYPVLETIKTASKTCHIELTNLVIPTLNDTDEHFERLVDWVEKNAGPQVPLHFSRYFPCNKMDIPPTHIDTLRRAEKIAKTKLKHVHLGNV